jgi:hypothetical protein
METEYRSSNKNEVGIKHVKLAALEVLTAVVMKTSTFWDITPCNPLKVNRRFGETCHVHLQGRRISQERNERESRRQREEQSQMAIRCYIPEGRALC